MIVHIDSWNIEKCSPKVLTKVDPDLAENQIANNKSNPKNKTFSQGLTTSQDYFKKFNNIDGSCYWAYQCPGIARFTILRTGEVGIEMIK